MYYLYILRSKKANWYYVGSTDNLEKRLLEHNRGKTKSTKPYIPFQLVYSEGFINKTEARRREFKIKRNHILKRELILKAGYKFR